MFIVVHMDVRDQIIAIEGRLRERGVSVARLCRSAEIAQTTWVRWKTGTPARNSNWARIEEAVATLCPDQDQAA
jgi:hypothetical protein